MRLLMLPDASNTINVAPGEEDEDAIAAANRACRPALPRDTYSPAKRSTSFRTTGER